MNITILDDVLESFCQRYPIQKLSLFGSALEGDFSSDSDIDVLVEFLPHARVGLFDMGRMSTELSQILGRNVDLVTKGFLSPLFRDDVVQQSQVIYEKIASE